MGAFGNRTVASSDWGLLSLGSRGAEEGLSCPLVWGWDGMEAGVGVGSVAEGGAILSVVLYWRLESRKV